jgi:protoporphyrinogen oxidase
MGIDIILGGGLAGLYYAYKNPKKRFIIIEKESEPGGLCRTFSFKGYRYDIGGHRFLTNYPEVLKSFKHLIGKDILSIERKSKIFIDTTFIDYPLNVSALRKFSPMKLSKILLENLRKKSSGEDLESDLIARFGNTIYQSFFKDYTQKVVGLRCDEISKDWSGSRIKDLDWKSIIKKLMRKEKTDRRNAGKHDMTHKNTYDNFFYPKDGCMQLTENIRKKTKNVKIITDANITQIRHDTNTIKEIRLEDGQVYRPEKVISTIPLNDLAAYLKKKTTLQYRCLILVYLQSIKPVLNTCIEA